MPDQGQRADEADNSGCSDAAGANVKNVRVLYLADRHLSDRVTGFWRQWCAQSRAEIFNRRNQHEVRQHTAAHH